MLVNDNKLILDVAYSSRVLPNTLHVSTTDSASVAVAMSPSDLMGVLVVLDTIQRDINIPQQFVHDCPLSTLANIRLAFTRFEHGTEFDFTKLVHRNKDGPYTVSMDEFGDSCDCLPEHPISPQAWAYLAFAVRIIAPYLEPLEAVSAEPVRRLPGTAGAENIRVFYQQAFGQMQSLAGALSLRPDVLGAPGEMHLSCRVCRNDHSQCRKQEGCLECVDNDGQCEELRLWDEE
ncbi:hypothetical protein F5Y18DRAFT_429463 [Xylariaceae sp. FL1019]|nr:hypothetical protein F5Y18DRAFT_429463 [Xylariaceae sp. FL1019]